MIDMNNYDRLCNKGRNMNKGINNMKNHIRFYDKSHRDIRISRTQKKQHISHSLTDKNSICDHRVRCLYLILERKIITLRPIILKSYFPAWLRVTYASTTISSSSTVLLITPSTTLAMSSTIITIPRGYHFSRWMLCGI